MNISSLDPAAIADAMRDDGMMAALADDRPDAADILDLTPDMQPDAPSVREGWWLICGTLAAAVVLGALAARLFG